MIDVEHVWTKIKTAASDLSSEGRTISRQQAEMVVMDICFRERADALPAKALRYLVDEMCVLVSVGHAG